MIKETCTHFAASGLDVERGSFQVRAMMFGDTVLK